MITACLLLLLRQRMTAAQPERFGAASKAHFIGDGAGWARFLAWLSVCATRAVMPYGILMLAIVGLTPADHRPRRDWCEPLLDCADDEVPNAVDGSRPYRAGACDRVVRGRVWQGATHRRHARRPPTAPFSATDSARGDRRTATADERSLSPTPAGCSTHPGLNRRGRSSILRRASRSSSASDVSLPVGIKASPGMKVGGSAVWSSRRTSATGRRWLAASRRTRPSCST